MTMSDSIVAITAARRTIGIVYSGIAGVPVGVGVGDGVGFGVWGGIGGRLSVYEVDGAASFWALSMGTMFTMPRFRSYLKSWIVRLMAWMSVEPHQLFAALTFEGSEVKVMLFWV